jgi:hypothetical protein
VNCIIPIFAVKKADFGTGMDIFVYLPAALGGAMC